MAVFMGVSSQIHKNSIPKMFFWKLRREIRRIRHSKTSWKLLLLQSSSNCSSRLVLTSVCPRFSFLFVHLSACTTSVSFQGLSLFLLWLALRGVSAEQSCPLSGPLLASPPPPGCRVKFPSQELFSGSGRPVGYKCLEFKRFFLVP